MSATRQLFLLPDLGEGLPDAEIVEWKVAVGTQVRLDEPLVAMETAKAVVDVPAPFSGRVLRLFGAPGDVIETGKPLAEFELDDGPQRAAAQDTGHHSTAPAPSSATTVPVAAAADSPRADSGTVVGAMASSDRLQQERAVEIGGIRAMPAVRALARKLGVDLSRIRGTGPDGSISSSDVQAARREHPDASTPQRSAPAAATVQREIPAGVEQTEALRGVRRNMARSMASAHAQVVPTTLMDDADIQAWAPGQDLTVRLIRALVAGARSEPALNAWFDGETLSRTLHPHVDVGVAIDTGDGLFVAALRNAQQLDATATRAALDQLRTQVRERSLPTEAMSRYTLMLSNFGIYAGRYATPVVLPPCVCILAAGRMRYEAVPVMGGIAAHRVIPLSLTFDHRACTGGEAARFLKAVLDDLARAI